MNPNLDLLRAVAVMCVFFGHLHDAYSAHTITSWHLGQLGVLIFFVHTSLVLLQSLERNGATDDLFRQFYIQRAFRIYPLAIVCVLISYVIGNWTLKELVSNLTLTQNLTYSQNMVGGLWSLPLEVQMYMVLPFLFIWFRRRSVYWPLVFWVLSIPVAIIAPIISGRLNVLGYAPCFLGGVIAWKMGRRQRLPGWLWPFALAATSIIWFASEREGNMYFRWAFCLVLGLMIPWFHELPWKRLNAVAKNVAKYSYGIYLSHMAVMELAFHDLNDQSQMVQWTVFVSLVTVLPLLAYHLIERPLVQVGKGLARHRRVFKPIIASSPFR